MEHGEDSRSGKDGHDSCAGREAARCGVNSLRVTSISGADVCAGHVTPGAAGGGVRPSAATIDYTNSITSGTLRITSCTGCGGAGRVNITTASSSEVVTRVTGQTLSHSEHEDHGSSHGNTLGLHLLDSERVF